jgi:hypothetical protein
MQLKKWRYKMKIPKVKRPSEITLKRVQSLKRKKGMIVAIEPQTGDWFLGKNVLEALERGRKKCPHSTFYFVRVGYSSAHAHKGGLKRA